MSLSLLYTILKDLFSWIGGFRKKQCLLVVDDDPTDCDWIRLLLQQIGYDCDIVEGTEAAMPILQIRQHPIVFIDLRLTHAPGRVLVEQIRREKMNGRLLNTRIVCTPGEMGDLANLPHSLNISVIGKPVTEESLRDLLNRRK